MADISSELAFVINQHGAEAVRAALLDIDRANKQTSGSTQTLTKFVKEQRRENLQANFLFRESRQVISSVGFAALSLASATGGASKEMQKINQTLVSGFSAFQASGFAMAALGIGTGGVATAIAAVLGLGTGFLAFMSDSGDDAENLAKRLADINKEFKEFLLNSSQISGGGKLGLLGVGKAATEADIKAADSAINDLRNRIKKIKTAQGEGDAGLMGVLGLGKLEALRQKVELINLEEELNQKLAEREQLYLRLGQAQDAIIKKTKEVDKDTGATPGRQTGAGDAWGISKLGRASRDAKKITDEFEKQRTVVMQLSSSFGNLQSGMHGLGIETDSWLGKLISAAQTLASIYEIVAAIKAITSIFSFGAGGALSSAGAVAPPLPGGGSIGGSADLQKVLRSPAVRNEMATMITDLARKGKI